MDTMPVCTYNMHVDQPKYASPHQARQDRDHGSVYQREVVCLSFRLCRFLARGILVCLTSKLFMLTVTRLCVPRIDLL